MNATSQTPLNHPEAESESRTGSGDLDPSLDILGWVRICWREFPWRFPGSFFVVLGGIFLEGVGISLFLPLLSLLEESEAGSRGRFEEWIADLARSVSIPLTLEVLLSVIALLFLVKSSCLFASRWLASSMSAEYRRRWLERLYDSTLRARVDFAKQERTGSLVGVMTEELELMAHAVVSVLLLSGYLFTIVIYTVISVLIDWRISLSIVTLGSIGYLGIRGVLQKGRRIAHSQQKCRASIHSKIVETIHALPLIKSMACEPLFLRRVQEDAREMRDHEVRLGFQESLLWNVGEPAILLMLCLAIYVGVTWFHMPLTVFLLLAGLLYRIYSRVSMIPPLLHDLNGRLPSVETVQRAYARSCAAQESVGGTRSLGRFEMLRLQGLHLDHGDTAILRGIDLEVEKGQFLALVGVSGGGKTTLLEVLGGLWSGYRGTYLVNGSIPFAELDRVSWKRRVGYVSQETQLFHGTIEENIAFFEPPDSSQVRKALDQACALEFVEALPDGISSKVVDRGASFSGGERQRLALARALYRQPEILILDEATSELDVDSEQLIQDLLKTLHGKVTILAAAHRLSTVREADRILVIESGKVIEEGDFEGLVKRDGTFSRMVRRSEKGISLSS
ncbi:MAG: ABC transporter ATP-binding protein [Planctomycetota bacterium]|jgi:ABC-type multidrug transport system fused ATPase/permease subunit|nr:ABC transporter ATP-binding protein [Planctomycetota bacterium]